MKNVSRIRRDRADQQSAVAALVAKRLFDEGLEGEELFVAMWDCHDETGLETRDIFAEYQLLARPPAA